MGTFGRIARLVCAVVATALVIVSNSAAATITGTDRNDTLRGTANADKIYGKKGKDKLYGLGGNDLLVPGAGADTVVCGSGRDTVLQSDRADAIAKDCEMIKRVGSPLPAPPPAPPPPTPPPPPPPPAVAGSYAGLSSQNERVTFDVLAAGPAVTKFRINSVNQSCQPPNLVSIFGPLDFGTGTATVVADGTFGFTYVGPGTISGNPANFDIRANGKFTGTTAAGTARFDMTFTLSGINFTCSSGNVTWTASRTF
jgi:hypothetical protein